MIRSRRHRPGQTGMTLMEVMISLAIMAVMLTLAWRSIVSTGDRRRRFEDYEGRNHELRMALGRIVADFEAAYLSKSEDQNASHPRTLMQGKTNGRFPDIRFSTMGHRPLWADANESEQTVISYLPHDDPDHSGVTDWLRKEQRRMSNEPPEIEPADYDVLVHNIASAKIEYWNWRNLEWVDRWDTTQSDGQKGQLPTRVRITIVVKDSEDHDYKLSTEARLRMQEPLAPIVNSN